MGKDKTKLGDRMKMYENLNFKKFSYHTLPICIRLDGRNFSKFTKGLKRPYDERLSKIMVEVCKRLVKETNAKIGYTQSDEITLILYKESIEKELYFCGKVFKINSILASLASVWFNKLVMDKIPEKKDLNPVFDCRSWEIASKEEACNVLLWRELDATKNSISMLAQHNFPHAYLQGKNSKDMKDILINEKNINWNKEPSFFKRGTYVQRKSFLRKFTKEEIEEINSKNPKANMDKEKKIIRHKIVELELEPFYKIKNKVEVVFENREQILKES